MIETVNLTKKYGSFTALDDLNLSISEGTVFGFVGQNGAGKSTISNIIMGNPKYELTEGSILVENEDITGTEPNERSKKGIFMSFQYPAEIPGVTMMNFLRTSYNSIKGKDLNVGEFSKLLNEKMDILEMDSKFRSRFVNSGFSGGEKKRSEILQMMLFEPKYAVLDEIDSGLDVDALKVVCNGIEKVRKISNTGILIITHYSKLLDYIKPDRVYVMKKGKIVKSGFAEIAEEIQKKGFN